MKFKKGDIVKGLKNGFAILNEKMTKGEVVEVWDEEMAVRILEHRNPDFIGKILWVINDNEDFKLVKPANKDCIVIYRKNNEVIALDKTTKERAVAKCHPEDEFDFKIGAKIAFGRLMVGDIKPHEAAAMKPHEAAAWFREELKGGKCSKTCVQCNANEIALQAIERQIPKKPLPEKRFFENGRCPNCKAVFLNKSTPYCGNCGQALKWEEGGEGNG